MFKDRLIYWLLEYISGAAMVLVPLTMIYPNIEAPVDAYIWAVQWFVVYLGVILISCASSMKQRLLLSKRIDQLSKKV